MLRSGARLLPSIVVIEGIYYKKGKCYEKSRTAWKPTWLYHAVGWLCNWLWQCVEVSVDVRTKWRRRLYASISGVPCFIRSSGNCYGVCSRTSIAGKSSFYVSKAGKTRPQMGNLWHCMSDWKYCTDGILYCCYWMDYLLFR